MNDVTISLSILLGFASVALGVCSLVLKSDCDHVSICYGLIEFKKTKSVPKTEAELDTVVVVQEGAKDTATLPE